MVKLVQQSADHFNVSGDLNRDTVPAYGAPIVQQLLEQAGNGKLTLNLTEVGHVDTAGLAWLINLLKAFKQRNIPWQLEHIPKTMLNLAKISDVEGILSVQ